MGESGYNVSPVVLPSLFGSPAAALQQAVGLQERNKERKYQIDYRNQKDAEADQWRKLNLIQNLTDLSKHQTGSDVADAIGNHLMSEVYQKYTTNVDKMSPQELQAKVQKDMSGIITGLDGAKSELDLADKQVMAIKQHYPEIDSAGIYDDIRKDIVDRHLNHSADGFRNPMEIGQPTLDLNNPEVLSRYVSNTKRLDDAIANPKGVEPITAVSGDPYTNVEYSGKIPHWMQTNFTENQKKNGFLPKGFMPQLSIKSEELPSDFLPALKGNARKMVTSDVHEQFMAEHPLELIAGTKAMFPNYDKMNEGERNLAQRDYLYNKIKSLDKSALNYKTSKTPSASMLKLWMGGSGSGDTSAEVNDIYNRIDTEVTRLKDYGEKRTPMALMDLDAQKVILDMVNTGKDEDSKLAAEEIFIEKSPKKEILIKGKSGNLIGSLPKVGTNLKVQPGVKEKRQVIQQGENKKENKNPLGLDL